MIFITCKLVLYTSDLYHIHIITNQSLCVPQQRWIMPVRISDILQSGIMHGYHFYDPWQTSYKWNESLNPSKLRLTLSFDLHQVSLAILQSAPTCLCYTSQYWPSPPRILTIRYLALCAPLKPSHSRMSHLGYRLNITWAAKFDKEQPGINPGARLMKRESCWLELYWLMCR